MEQKNKHFLHFNIISLYFVCLGGGGGGGKRIVQKVWVMDIRCQEKVVCNDLLDMCTKILELYDSHCSFPGLKSNFAYL